MFFCGKAPKKDRLKTIAKIVHSSIRLLYLKSFKKILARTWFVLKESSSLKEMKKLSVASSLHLLLASVIEYDCQSLYFFRSIQNSLLMRCGWQCMRSRYCWNLLLQIRFISCLLNFLSRALLWSPSSANSNCNYLEVMRSRTV